MEVAEYTLPIRNLVDDARRVSLFLPDQPGLDLLASVFAWRNVLKLREKDVRLAAESLKKEQFSKLPHINEVKVPLPQPEMRIKVDLRSGGVSRVNYQTHEDTLVFYLTPKGRPLSQEQVTIEQGDGFADLIFTFGFHDNSKLTAYQEVSLVNIDTDLENTRFGKINLVNGSASGFSELTAQTLSELNWPLESETASILLAGIYAATSGFTKRVKSSTFETASELTQTGADVTLASSFGGSNGPAFAGTASAD